MVSQEIQHINRQLWQERILPGEESSFLEFYAGKTPRQIQAQTVSNAPLEGIAFNLSHTTFNLMVGERQELALQAADLLIQISEEALKTESYNRIYYAIDPVAGKPLDPSGNLPDNAILPTQRELKIEKQHGRKNTLGFLHYGLWFKTDSRPIDILRESVEIAKEVYKARHEDFDVLVMNAVQAEDYEYALGMCRRKVPKAVFPPADNHFKRNVNYVLCLLCEYALGNAEMRDFAQAGVEYWYERAMKWVPPIVGFSWDTRLAWAYLRGKHFTGVTGAKALIRDLKGY